jgi:MYXO-CTERM domain-containing protein
LALPLGLLSLSSAFAYSTGQTTTGLTPGCGCHGAASATTTSEFGPAPITVVPGQLVSLTFEVSTTDPLRVSAGLDVLATGGTLQPGAGTQLVSGQVTHSGPVVLSAGSVTFDLQWVAPLLEGTYTLKGAGNAVDGGGSAAGDGWDLAPDLLITVDDGCDDFDLDGFENCDGDCDDTDSTVWPGAPETCDGIDEDCDGDTDEGASDAPSWYADGDSDGYGAGAPVPACQPPAGHAALDGDCDDAAATYNPGAAELDCADPHDYNCDGATGFVDQDQDGFAACEECDDTDSAVHPGAPETCDGADNDCDGIPDGPAPTDGLQLYRDADLDGHGDLSLPVVACAVVPGLSATSDDCDDAEASVSPSALEIWYDGVDQDCDGNDDDQDGDGVPAPADCVDTDAQVFPGASDAPYDGLDGDCDGASDFDADGDGYDAAPPTGAGSDCDDADPAVHPEAQDPSCDGVDLDCDPVPDTAPECEQAPVSSPSPETCGCQTQSPSAGGWLGAALALLLGAQKRRSPLAGRSQ